jgi:L-alanine-DL-glutamate epimerase-like enolase superfamily enzyme
MTLRITAMVERWPVAGQFIIARGAKQFVDVLLVAVSDGQHIGYGEGTAIYYRGETAEKCLGEVERVMDGLMAHDVVTARMLLQSLMSPGAARNAVDCALWDLEAKQTATPLWKLAGLARPPVALQTAFTISLGTPERMAEDAAAAAAKGYTLLKLKLQGSGDLDRVAAVRAGAPACRMIVDANESWSPSDIGPLTGALKNLGVAMVEQPFPPDSDFHLADIRADLPIFADESCHSVADIGRLKGLYQGINIKLDKAGGLTEAMLLAKAADEAGLEYMVGCMLCTSLGIAPAFIVAQNAIWADLDGPALLSRDRPDAFVYSGGYVFANDG